METTNHRNDSILYAAGQLTSGGPGGYRGPGGFHTEGRAAIEGRAASI